MATTLTTEQRWLLWAIGGWEMRDCLLGPAGTDPFMTSMSSHHGSSAPAGAPTWLTGWNTASRRITAPSLGQTRVVVTAAQINAYARQLSADIRADLQACRAAAHAEMNRTAEWCHCPWAHHAPNTHSRPCRRYHPTEAEDLDHQATTARIDQHTRAVLRRALGLVDDQLTLF